MSVVDDGHGEEGNMADDPLKDAAQTALRDDFYGMSGRNLSSGSVESTNLHDHRFVDAAWMRCRWEVVIC